MTMLKHRHMLRKTKVSEQQGYRVKETKAKDASVNPSLTI